MKIYLVVLGLTLSSCVTTSKCTTTTVNRFESLEVSEKEVSAELEMKHMVKIEGKLMGGEVKSNQKPPEILTKTNPVYPCEAKVSNMEGKVILKVLLDETGTPVKYVVLSSTNQWFTSVSVNAMMETRFRPAEVDGKKVKVWITYPFMYKLQN